MAGLKNIRYSLALLVVISILGLSACTSKNVSADNIENSVNSKIEKKTQENSNEKHENSNQEIVLLYREYQIGSHMEAGDIMISKEVIEETTDNPEAIIIFYNDTILKTIPYEGEELSFHLEKAGWYCFAVLEENQMIDISEKVTSFESVENSHIMPLN